MSPTFYEFNMFHIEQGQVMNRELTYSMERVICQPLLFGTNLKGSEFFFRLQQPVFFHPAP